MICISQHDFDAVSNIIIKNLAKLCTCCGMHEICDCLNLFVLTLFYHSHTHHFMLILFHREKLYADIFCLMIFPSMMLLKCNWLLK